MPSTVTGSPASSCDSTRPCRPSRPSPDSSSPAFASSAASHSTASGSVGDDRCVDGARALGCGPDRRHGDADEVAGDDGDGRAHARHPRTRARGQCGQCRRAGGPVCSRPDSFAVSWLRNRWGPAVRSGPHRPVGRTVGGMEERIILEGFDPPKNRRHGPDGDLVDVHGWLHAPVAWTGGPLLERAWRERHGRSRLGVGLAVANNPRRHILLTNVPPDLDFLQRRARVAHRRASTRTRWPTSRTPSNDLHPSRWGRLHRLAPEARPPLVGCARDETGDRDGGRRRAGLRRDREGSAGPVRRRPPHRAGGVGRRGARPVGRLVAA